MLKYLNSITLLFFLIFSMAYAQQRQQQPSPWSTPDKYGEWEFSIYFGAGFIGDTSGATPIAGGEELRLVTLDYTSGFSAGVRLTQNLGKRLGAELEYTFSNQPLAFLNLTPDLPRYDASHDVHTFQYNILFYGFDRSSRLRPYGQVGGGAQLFYIGGSSKNDALTRGIVFTETWKFAANFGGGVKYLVGKDWGFRFDFRDVLSGAPDYGLPPTAGETTAGFRPNVMLQNWQVNVGFFYTWEQF